LAAHTPPCLDPGADAHIDVDRQFEAVRNRLKPRAGTSGHAGSRPTGESGQALLELALVVPILVILVMAIFQFAYVVETQMGLTNAVREAGRRVAATDPTGVVNWTTEADWVVDQLCGTGSGCNAGLLQQNVQGFNESQLWATYPVVTFCRDSVNSTTQYRVNIEVKYKHPIFFGLLTFATDAVDGTNNGFYDMSVTAQLRMENVDTTVTQTAPSGGTCS
jgi:Flp pilus assembly protein TadG